MNIAGITGNLTADPELKTTQSGISVCSFTVAVRRPHTKDTTDFIDCVAWKEKAEFITKYFSKGKKIEISGYLTTRVYGKEGAKRKATELICDTVGFGGKKEDSFSSSPAPAQNPVPEAGQNDGFAPLPLDDDLPF